ncbi:hypothetical protein SAMN05443665_103981 [Actinomadura meyerae]|uniref:Uncharacterized protein n=1 Tax=Actinomadura meyerae TaxID=240840 RepID=A0A239NFF3_9ACTN|nr:hypothetical protein [Actinomadura meyerae]SNT53028.1 hypothetical protein SAMN05443665_103981 [Actinomadura meyerae]
MTNLPNTSSPPCPRGRMAVPAMTMERVELLVRLMVSLRGLGRGSVLYMHGRAEPVLAVPAVSRRRSIAVLVVQDRSGWSYLWDAAHRTPARSAPVAAELIAGVTR